MAGGRGARVAGALLAVGALGVLVAPARLVPTGGTGTGTAPAAAPGTGRATAVVATDDRAAGADATGPAGTALDEGPDRAAPAGADPAGAADLRLVELRGGWRTGEDLGTAAAVALLAGAAHLATAAPRGPAPRLAVEAVEQPGPDAAVVTLLVAPPGGGADDAGTTARLAVPVALGPGGVRVAGSPWSLPGPALTPDPPAGRPVRDEDLVAAARDALDRAGLDGTALTGLEATDGWPFLTRLADGADGPWLRWHLDRFVVTGLPLHEAAGTGQGTGVP